MPKIVECFLFYNETLLLNYRFKTSVADYFIIIEAKETFSGKKKELIFPSISLPDSLKEKVIYIVADDIETDDPWKREKFQRNCIDIGLKKLTLNPDDIVVISDLDEIPDPDIMSCLRNTTMPDFVVSMEQDLYYYNLNTLSELKWYKSKVLSYSTYSLYQNPESIRMSPPIQILPSSGWHLSYFGDASYIKNKIESSSHQELNIKEFTDTDHINKALTEQIDLFNRPTERFKKISIYDKSRKLPPKFEILLKDFYLF